MSDASAEDTGTELSLDPDRQTQAGETPAEHEREPDAVREGQSDLVDGAWRTTATFDQELDAPTGELRSSGDEDENVDPIVHRGE